MQALCDVIVSEFICVSFLLCLNGAASPPLACTIFPFLFNIKTHVLSGMLIKVSHLGMSALKFLILYIFSPHEG